MISGRVQGVWFRASTKQQADSLGLSGWVRNCRSGAVEVLAEGEAAAIDKLIAWCRSGPAGATVSDVKIEIEAYGGELSGFRVERTV